MRSSSEEGSYSRLFASLNSRPRVIQEKKENDLLDVGARGLGQLALLRGPASVLSGTNPGRAATVEKHHQDTFQNYSRIAVTFGFLGGKNSAAG